jgi:hypothetical protein
LIDTLRKLIDRFDDPLFAKADIIPWSCPVPSFGDLSSAVVATLGLNPSKREFLDNNGAELDGKSRRLHTLRSLGISRWSQVTTHHVQLIDTCCREYFKQNPYDGWFRALDNLISGTNASYYCESATACHLDLIPYATVCKWTELSPRQRSDLLGLAGDTLGLLLRDARVRVLILNGQSVVSNLERLAKVKFKQSVMPDWTLPRNGGGVVGVAYTGEVHQIADIRLKRPVQALGFNHNIQSSFGVTSQVKASIRHWITSSVKGARLATTR